MATSRFQTAMYSAEQFVESAGTVLFQLSTREICILRLQSDEYVLPKGRRNLGESCQTTATRETTEETGIPCRLLPVNFASRICPAIETEHLPDEARSYRGISAVNEGEPVGQHENDKFDVEFHSYNAALEKLTFKDDRELVKGAIELVQSTLDSQSSIQ